MEILSVIVVLAVAGLIVLAFLLRKWAKENSTECKKVDEAMIEWTPANPVVEVKKKRAKKATGPVTIVKPAGKRAVKKKNA